MGGIRISIKIKLIISDPWDPQHSLDIYMDVSTNTNNFLQALSPLVIMTT